jgi:hypothetical protein
MAFPPDVFVEYSFFASGVYLLRGGELVKTAVTCSVPADTNTWRTNVYAK